MTDDQFKIMEDETLGIFHQREVGITGIEAAVDKICDNVYNSAIEDVLSVVKVYNTGKELSPLFNQLIPKIQSLKK